MDHEDNSLSMGNDMASFWRGHLVSSKAFLQGGLRLSVDFDMGNVKYILPIERWISLFCLRCDVTV